MNAADLGNLAALCVIGSAALAALGWMTSKGWKALKRLDRFLDDYEGTPARPGVDARPGVMERLKTQDQILEEVVEKVTAISAELPKNGVPLAHKIDALWTKHLRDEGRLVGDEH